MTAQLYIISSNRRTASKINGNSYIVSKIISIIIEIQNSCVCIK